MRTLCDANTFKSITNTYCLICCRFDRERSNYKMLYLIFSLLLPTAVPILGWGERPLYALFCCFFTRVVIQLNATWLVNSAAHLYGTRPFDKYVYQTSSSSLAD